MLTSYEVTILNDRLAEVYATPWCVARMFGAKPWTRRAVLLGNNWLWASTAFVADVFATAAIERAFAAWRQQLASQL